MVALACGLPDAASCHAVARSSARRLLRFWAMLVWSIGAYVAGIVIGLTSLVVVFPPASLACLMFVGLVALPLWVLSLLLPRDRMSEHPGIEISLSDESRLSDWLSDACHVLDVTAPTRLRMTEAPACWALPLQQEPVLVLGTGLCAWVRTPELARLAAAELSTLRWRNDPVVLRGLRLVDRLDFAPLFGNRTPMLRWFLRVLGRGLKTRGEQLCVAARTWSDACVPYERRARDADLIDATIASEGWHLLRQQWLLAAATLRLPLEDLATAQRQLLACCEDEGWIERADPRPEGPHAMTLLRSPAEVDRQVTALECARWANPEAESVSWENYAERVTIPVWRANAAQGLYAASAVMGDPVPASLEGWLGLLEQGCSSSVQLMLDRDTVTPGGVPPPAPDRGVETTLTVARVFADTLSIALVDAGVATPQLHWLAGVVLVDGDGRVLQTIAIEDMVANGEWQGLRDLIADAGLRSDQLLWIGDSRTVRLRRTGVGFVAKTWDLRNRYVIVADGWIHLYKHGTRGWRDFGFRLMNSAQTVTEQRLQSYLDRAVLHDRPETHRWKALNLASVRDALLVLQPTHSWTLTLSSTQTARLRLRGDGQGVALQSALEPLLADRLRVLTAQPTSLRWRRRLRWLGVSCLGLGLVSWIVGLQIVNATLRKPDTQDHTQPMELLWTLAIFGLCFVVVGATCDYWARFKAHPQTQDLRTMPTR